MANEDQIREAAYFVWLNNGCPEGVEIECWLEAEGGDVCCCEKTDATFCSEEGCVCVKCNHSPCTCDPCTCGDECPACSCSGEKKKAAPKKAAAKKTVEKAEKKAPAKKAAAKK